MDAGESVNFFISRSSYNFLWLHYRVDLFNNFIMKYHALTSLQSRRDLMFQLFYPCFCFVRFVLVFAFVLSSMILPALQLNRDLTSALNIVFSKLLDKRCIFH